MYKTTVDRVLKHDGTDADTPVAGTANAYTHSHKITDASNIAIACRAKSDSGTPDIDLYLEQTHIDPSTVETGENASGDADNGWVQNTTKVGDITDENWIQFTISAKSLPFLRFFADGQGSNPADCLLEIRISKQAQY